MDRATSLRGTTYLVMANGMSLALGVISAAVQARALGPIGRGDLATAIVPGTILGMLLCLGLPDYFARRTALGAGRRGSAAVAAWLSLAISVVFIAPYLYSAQLLAPAGSDSWWLLIEFAVATPLLTFGYSAIAIATGASQWHIVAFSKVLPQMLTVAALLALLLFHPTVISVGTILIASTILGLLVPAAMAGIFPAGKVVLQDFKESLSFGFRGWGAGALALLNQRVDLLMLTVLAPKDQLGFYAVATTVASVFSAISTAIALPARNEVARGDLAGAPRVSSIAVSSTFVLGAIASAILPWVVKLVLGKAFLGALPVMWILIGAQVPMAAVVVLTAVLVGAGRPGAPLLSEGVALVTTVVMIASLFNVWGTPLAAFANMAANFVSLAALIYLVRKHVIRVPVWRFFVPTPGEIRTMAAIVGRRLRKGRA